MNDPNPRPYIQNVIQEIALTAALTPDMVNQFVETYTNTLVNATVGVKHHYKQATALFFDRTDTENRYSIVAASTPEEAYVYLVIVNLKPHIYAANKKLVTLFKELHPEIAGVNMGTEIRKITNLHKTVEELYSVNTRTTRTPYGPEEHKTWDKPSLEELERFYKCGRKVAHQTYEEALTEAHEGEHPYKCNYCGLYHRGKEPTGIKIPLHIQHGRWVTTWRRKHNV